MQYIDDQVKFIKQIQNKIVLIETLITFENYILGLSSITLTTKKKAFIQISIELQKEMFHLNKVQKIKLKKNMLES